MPASWALYIFAAWFVIAAAGLIRIGVGFWRLRQLRKSCVRIDDVAPRPRFRKLWKYSTPRSVAVCVSDGLRVPTAIGFIKPLVVIPSWAMQELSATELNAILLHELAHLRRWDDWTNLVQKVLGALLFFHPAVWWIEKKLALEREMACDDLVLAEDRRVRASMPNAWSRWPRKLCCEGNGSGAGGGWTHAAHVTSSCADIGRKASGRDAGLETSSDPAHGTFGRLPDGVFRMRPRLVSFEAESRRVRPAAASAVASSAIDRIPDIGARVVPAKFVVSSSQQNSGFVAGKDCAANIKAKST